MARLSPLALAALLLGAGAGAAPIVTASEGPIAARLPVGAHLPDAYALTLGAGDAVTIATGGATRTLRGPGTFTPSSATTAAAGSPCRARNALGGCADQQERGGGVRSLDELGDSANAAPANATEPAAPPPPQR